MNDANFTKNLETIIDLLNERNDLINRNNEDVVTMLNKKIVNRLTVDSLIVLCNIQFLSTDFIDMCNPSKTILNRFTQLNQSINDQIGYQTLHVPNNNYLKIHFDSIKYNIKNPSMNECLILIIKIIDEYDNNPI